MKLFGNEKQTELKHYRDDPAYSKAAAEVDKMQADLPALKAEELNLSKAEEAARKQQDKAVLLQQHFGRGTAEQVEAARAAYEEARKNAGLARIEIDEIEATTSGRQELKVQLGIEAKFSYWAAAIDVCEAKSEPYRQGLGALVTAADLLAGIQEQLAEMFPQRSVDTAHPVPYLAGLAGNHVFVDQRFTSSAKSVHQNSVVEWLIDENRKAIEGMRAAMRAAKAEAKKDAA